MSDYPPEEQKKAEQRESWLIIHLTDLILKRKFPGKYDAELEQASKDVDEKSSEPDTLLDPAWRKQTIAEPMQ
jgi:hypothetical protein